MKWVFLHVKISLVSFKQMNVIKCQCDVKNKGRDFSELKNSCKYYRNCICQSLFDDLSKEEGKGRKMKEITKKKENRNFFF